MKAQTPRVNLIDPETEIEYFAPYIDNANNNDEYYLGIKYADLETITDELDDFMSYVGVALSNYAYKWQKLYDTTQLEYNPLWNVDATITEERDIASRHTEDTIGGADVTTTNGAAPYDSDTFHDTNQSNTVSLEHVDEHDEDAYLDTITTTRTGNIGVTTASQLIEGERKIADMNMLDIIMADIINFVTYPYFGG